VGRIRGSAHTYNRSNIFCMLVSRLSGTIPALQLLATVALSHALSRSVTKYNWRLGTSVGLCFIGVACFPERPLTCSLTARLCANVSYWLLAASRHQPPVPDLRLPDVELMFEVGPCRLLY